MVLLFSPHLHGEEREFIESDVLTAGVGAFDVTDTNKLAPEGFVEYRFGSRHLRQYWGESFRGIGPMVGLKANTDGGIMGHGSLFLDFQPWENWVLWPSAGIGGYRQGSSRDLGGSFQFHLGGFIGYRLGERSMLGASLQHVSNAGLQPINPGADSVFISYSILFD